MIKKIEDENYGVLEQAFLKEKVNAVSTDEITGIKTKFESNNDGLVITKSQDISNILKSNKEQRDNFKGVGRDEHWMKFAQVPMIVYDQLMREADLAGITCSKEKSKYVIHRIKTGKEFEYFLTVPKSYLRK